MTTTKHRKPSQTATHCRSKDTTTTTKCHKPSQTAAKRRRQSTNTKTPPKTMGACWYRAAAVART
eukprot:13581282-Alexandrium_andersonii.AAC.1